MANPSLSKTLNNAYKAAISNNSFNMSMDRMTSEGTAAKTVGLFTVVALTAAATMVLNPNVNAFTIMASLIAGLGLNLWITFSKTVRPAAMVAYSAVEGFVIGVISSLYELQYPGIVMNAVVGTFAAAGGMLFAWSKGLIKIDTKKIKLFTYALVGYMLFGLINLGFSIFTGANVYTSPLGILASLVGVGLATYSVGVDLQIIQSGIESRLPKENEWRGAFGLIVTLIWLYIEILRLLGLFSRK